MVAAEAGADALGFILAPSRRQVDASFVAELREQLRPVRVKPRLVVVVVNEADDDLSRIVETAAPDVVQLSGDEKPSVLDWLSLAVFRTVRVPVASGYEDVRGMIEPWLDHARPVEAVLIEAHSAGHFGGTGRLADWELAARLAETYPVVLAGGLTPENVAEGVETVKPSGVDVSSGVETDGIKDPERIRGFVRQARQAFRTGQDTGHAGE